MGNHNKIRVLYLVSTLRNTGPTNQLFNIVRGLNKEKFDATVMTLSPEPVNTKVDDFKDVGIKVVPIGLSRLAGFIYAKKMVEEYILNEGVDILHCQGVRADSIAAKLEGSCITMATMRNFPQLDYPMTYGKIIGSIFKIWHLANLRRIGSVVGVSESVSTNLNRFGVQNVVTINNGVDIGRFKTLDQSYKKEFDELGFSKNTKKKTWIYVGHINSRKRVQVLLEAWVKIPLEERDNLVLLGEGDLLLDLKGKYEQEGIAFLGKVENVPKYLQASHFFISTSSAEGLPNAVIEAMACGLPSLLSDIDPHREILCKDKRAGVLFELDNKEDLIDKYYKLKDRDYNSSREASVGLVNRYYESKVMSAKYQDLYLKLRGCE